MKNWAKKSHSLQGETTITTTDPPTTTTTSTTTVQTIPELGICPFLYFDVSPGEPDSEHGECRLFMGAGKAYFDLRINKLFSKV
jgi:hypothetical protein